MPEITSWTDIDGDVFAPAVEHIKDMAVRLGLDFVEQHATHHSARRFHVYQGKTCLVSADDPMQVEHYLYGFRDGRSIRVIGSSAAANALLEAEHAAKDVLKWIDKVDEFVDPLTRERA